MEETKVSKREWVKTAAIIFLAILLVLTFFSNTIMNATLPEVAAQQIEGGTINAKIRGSGTVGANETYDVTINQTRKIASVLVKVGQTVNAGDTLFLLEAQESDEVKAAQDELDQLELSYEKSLIDAGNNSAKENHEVQKARDAYNEALALYHQYSTVDASQLAAEKTKAEQQLTLLQQASKVAQEQYDARTAEKSNLENQASELKAQTASLRTILDKQGELDAANNTLKQDEIQYINDYNRVLTIAGQDAQVAMSYARYPETLAQKLEDTDLNGVSTTSMNSVSPLTEDDNTGAGTNPSGGTTITTDPRLKRAQEMATAYITIATDREKVNSLQTEVNRLVEDTSEINSVYEANAMYQSTLSGYNQIQQQLATFDAETQGLKQAADAAAQAVTDQQAVVQKLTDAGSAAETVKSAKASLEELLFNQQLGDSSYLDMQAAKETIEKKRKALEELTANADELEVTAKVGGVVASIEVTAGNSIGPDTPLAKLNVADRGYTIKISVTAEQAKRVKVGDKADVVNYWGGNVEAVLENIARDPNTSGNNLLVFKLTGDVDPNTNLTLSIGQKSASYDALVPNSAVRTDNNGTFVLALTSKSTPLSTRYTATRVPVQVLAQDDTMSAVSGIGAGEFVITTSTKPIEAGTQVKLADNG